MEFLHSDAFATYALFAMALIAILTSIDMFGGVLLPRPKKVPISAEAGSRSGGALVSPEGPAHMRAVHRNAMANIIPFLLVMLIYVLLGASALWVTILCGVFTAMRLAHAIAHIRTIQPWRTIVWLIAQSCLFVAMFQVIHAALAVV
jgi:microsomal prostaglandin-E synthase 1